MRPSGTFSNAWQNRPAVCSWLRISHWADPDSLKLLSYMARETADINLWLVATYRTDELHRRHPLTATLAELSRDRFTTRTVESVLAIQVRAGLHTGECRVTGNDLSGLAVHIASRLCDLAGTREVLVSGTVRDLVIGSTLSFEDRGVRTLKGVPGEWHLLSVSADNR